MNNPSFSNALERVPQTQRTLLLTAAVFLATGLIGFMAIYTPWQQQRNQMEQQYQEEQQRTELFSVIRGQEKKLTEEEEKLLLPTGGTAALTGEVARLASKNAITIESITPQSQASFGPYTRFQIQVLATARFQDLFQFLRDLEQERPLLKIDQIEIGSPSQQTQESSRGLNRSNAEEIAPASEELQKTKLLISGLSKQGASS